MSKILVIDDELDLMEMLQMRLEASGYEVISASHGEEGIERAKEESPDLIILDVMMPGIDGYETCSRLKSDANLKSIPVIMASAKAQAEDIQKGLASGADTYLTKPFEPAILIEKVEAFLKRER